MVKHFTTSSSMCPALIIGSLLISSIAYGSEPPASWQAKDIQLKQFTLDSLTQQGDGWYAYSAPQIAGQRGPCCLSNELQFGLKSPASRNLNEGCLLGEGAHFYGYHSQSKLSSNIVTLAQLADGHIKDILVVGDSCPLRTGDQTITWLPDVKAEDSIHWLSQIAQQSQDHHHAHQAIIGIAQHASDHAVPTLKALTHQLNDDLAGTAIHGLGMTGSKTRFKVLTELYDELKDTDKRQHIGFALAEQDTPQAVKQIKQIIEKDDNDDVRQAALFALSQSNQADVAAYLQQFILTETSHSIQTSAVYALAELEGSDATARLWQLVDQLKPTGDKNTLSKARGDILGSVWYSLIERDPVQAVTKAQRYLLETENDAVITMILSALSDVEYKETPHPLLAMLKAPYPHQVRQHALFHLADSDDPVVLNELFSLIEQ